MTANNARAEQAMREFLEALGVDLTARGMERTPARVAQMWARGRAAYSVLLDG